MCFKTAVDAWLKKINHQINAIKEINVCICEHNNSWTVWVIIMKFLREPDVVKSSDEFDNGCIPVHCGKRVAV